MNQIIENHDTLVLITNDDPAGNFQFQTMAAYREAENRPDSLILINIKDLYQIKRCVPGLIYILEDEGLDKTDDICESVLKFSEAGIDLKGIVLNAFDFFLYIKVQRFIELKFRLPGMEFYFKPDRSDTTSELAMLAFSLGFNGLVYTENKYPAASFSGEMIKSLPETTLKKEGIDSLRSDIDEIDRELLNLLAKRFETGSLLAQAKMQCHIPIIQPERWKFILEDAAIYGAGAGLPASFVEEIFNSIHLQSVMSQIILFSRKNIGVKDKK